MGTMYSMPLCPRGYLGNDASKAAKDTDVSNTDMNNNQIGGNVTQEMKSAVTEQPLGLINPTSNMADEVVDGQGVVDVDVDLDDDLFVDETDSGLDPCSEPETEEVRSRSDAMDEGINRDEEEEEEEDKNSDIELSLPNDEVEVVGDPIERPPEPTVPDERVGDEDQLYQKTENNLNVNMASLVISDHTMDDRSMER